jgi:hypothetical protein
MLLMLLVNLMMMMIVIIHHCDYPPPIQPPPPQPPQPPHHYHYHHHHHHHHSHNHYHFNHNRNHYLHHRHHHYNHHSRNSLSAAEMILVCLISNLWFFLCHLFQLVKCIFDSSASVNMMMAMNVCITFATVMSTNLNSHSHNSCLDVYDNSIHKVRNVFWSIRC